MYSRHVTIYKAMISLCIWTLGSWNPVGAPRVIRSYVPKAYPMVCTSFFVVHIRANKVSGCSTMYSHQDVCSPISDPSKWGPLLLDCNFQNQIRPFSLWINHLRYVTIVTESRPVQRGTQSKSGLDNVCFSLIWKNLGVREQEIIGSLI